MITGVRFPVPLTDVGFPDPMQLGDVTVWVGEMAWAWRDAAPQFEVSTAAPPASAVPVEGWGIDHVVLLTPDLESTVEQLSAVGADLRRRADVRGRPAAFLLAGVLVEVVESAVDRPLLWGLALETTEDLDAVAMRWRAAGWDATDPHDAIQPGRRIFSVRTTSLAVMSARGDLSRE